MDAVCSQAVNDTLNAIRSGVLMANGTDDMADEYSILENVLGANCTDWWLSSINRTSMDFLGDDTGGTNSSFSDKEENPSYFSRDYRLVGTLFQGLILLVGVLGNLLVVMVVYRTRSMHSPTNCYLVSLAAADCVVLIASVPNEILSYYVIGSQWIWGPIGCAVFVFLQNLGENQRVVAEFDGVHGRALHRHLPSDEGAKRLHGETGQKDSGRCLGVCILLFVTLAGPHHHRANPLQRISNGRALRHETIAGRIPGLFLCRHCGVLFGAVAHFVRPLRPHRARLVQRPL
ncbi:Uncharacterized protein APZ42_016285 [Daphnia magna]|uniref:Thyrotropin-releasing hormone receptor n=1 Tax=Daphnia magna TaxID=35525 RepID=A0A165AIC4_9CRUS|nr:Uncharacterized protein APZ42_016285 [Daphnia magna]